MTPEAKVKNAVKKLLDAYGAYYFMPTGAGWGKAGIPDIICCHYGHFIGIECKAGKGRTTALQDRELERITMRGGHAIVVSDKPGDMEALEALLKKLKEPK